MPSMKIILGGIFYIEVSVGIESCDPSNIMVDPPCEHACASLGMHEYPIIIVS